MKAEKKFKIWSIEHQVKFTRERSEAGRGIVKVKK